jgi:hypothetical protein
MPDSHMSSGSSWTFWSDVQNERVARRLLFETFSVETEGTSSLHCIVHEGDCKDDISADPHHLDESGKDNPHGWFFENLLPLCSNLNEAIQRSRNKRDDLLENHEHLSRASLCELYRRYQITGRLRFAYAAARLGAFLTASGSKTQENVAESLEFASKCLLSLRGVRPSFSIPLATDTVARSALVLSNPALIISRRMAEAVLSLVVAIASFHRDFGDTEMAFRYYTLAFPLADLAQLDWLDKKLIAFANHLRILMSGIGDDVKAHHLLDFIKDKGYGKTLHEKLNILHWRDRGWPGSKRLQRQERAEQFLADIAQLEREYYDRAVTPSAAFGDPSSKLKGTTRLSSWDQIEILYLLADAHFFLSEGESQNGGHSDAAKEALHSASKLQHIGKFAVSGLATQKVFGEILRMYPDDPVFQFEFRSPDMLNVACRRTAGDGAFRFSKLSNELLQQVTAWLGSAPKAWQGMKEVKEIVG